MKKLKSFFAPTVTLRIESPDTNILNRLRVFGIISTKMTQDVLEVTIPLVNKDQAVAILRNQTYSIRTSRNILQPLNFLYKRGFLSLMLALTLCLVILLGNLVFRINIEGLEGEEKQKVAAFLSDNGIRTLTPRGRYDDSLSAGITSAFDFISHTVVYVRGNTLVVRVYKTRMPEMRPMTDIISPHNAVITRMMVFSGIPLVKVNDVVMSGQILVQAAFQVAAEPTEPNEMGQMQYNRITHPTHAVALIWGRISHSSSQIVTATHEVEGTKQKLTQQITEKLGTTPAREDIKHFVTQTQEGILVEVVINEIVQLSGL